MKWFKKAGNRLEFVPKQAGKVPERQRAAEGSLCASLKETDAQKNYKHLVRKKQQTAGKSDHKHRKGDKDRKCETEHQTGRG